MKIGIVGGIGSGKSTVSSVLKDLGYEVIDCDKIYKELSFEKEYVDLVEKAFPGSVINGQIDRKILGETVFADKQKLNQLNNLAHPLVLKKLDSIVSNIDKDVFVEVQVLDESIKNYLDKIILVEADMKLRIQRVIARSGYSKDYVKKIISSQTSDEEYEKIANYIILNNKGIQEIKQQLIKILA